MTTCNYSTPSPMKDTGNYPGSIRPWSQSSATNSSSATISTSSFAQSFELSILVNHVVIGLTLLLSLLVLLLLA